MTTKAPQKAPEVRTVAWKGLTWVNIERPSLAEIEYLKQLYPFHPLALEDCLSRLQLPKIDEFEDHLFLVLHFPVFSHKARITLPSQVSIFAGATYVVTVHQGDLRPLTKLFYDCEHSEEVRSQIMGHSSGLLLYKVLDTLVDYCFPIVNNIIENVNGVEEHLFEHNPGRIVRELSIIRRDIIAYRRIIRPQIGVMEALEQKEYPVLKVDPDLYFGDLADHTRRIWTELEELKEVAEGLNDSVFTLNSYLANDVIRILTVIFTVSIPAAVLGTFYGMNIPLPGGVETGSWTFFGKYTTLIVITLLAIIPAGLMLWVFRRLRWI